jgi:hypothetical protein
MGNPFRIHTSCAFATMNEPLVVRNFAGKRIDLKSASFANLSTFLPTLFSANKARCFEPAPINLALVTLQRSTCSRQFHLIRSRFTQEEDCKITTDACSINYRSRR